MNWGDKLNPLRGFSLTLPLVPALYFLDNGTCHCLLRNFAVNLLCIVSCLTTLHYTLVSPLISSLASESTLTYVY